MGKSELHLQTVISELFAENAYLAHLDGRDDCLVIDPGLEPQPILDYLDQRQLTCAAILNTHGHADHIAGNAAVKTRFPDAPVVIGSGDAAKLTDPWQNLSAQFGIQLVSPPADQLVNHGDTIEFAGFEMEVRDTPGHSSGHVVFIWRGESPWVVFGGDLLFRGSIGRTDFPDGSLDELVTSIREQLFTLPPDTRILSGHGEPTTIGHERQFNPFVGSA